ncbi:MAG: class I SAM-dependent methyltransferase [Treponema sp.]|nr:class I SAM-dependent methyltransferase [Treponema sp.]MCL2251820.1 class I SAM-dependent methyltransferase [Treponema sp.]
MEDKTKDQAEILANRLQKRFRHLKKWAQRTGAGAFRLYDKDIPEIPLVLDFYGDCSKTNEAALSGALYKRPYEKDEAEEENWLSAMKESASNALGIPLDRIFLKQRLRQRGDAQYEKISQTHFEKIITEGGLSFKVNLSDYLDTGIFPDRRLLRNIVRSESADKKMLNLFSYTSSFSVYAAFGGALSTDSVDLSNTYLNWSRENFSLNGMSSSILQQWDFFSGNSSAANKLIRADVVEFLEKAIQAKMKWDVIVLDPPAFSNSKKMNENFDLNRDLLILLGNCLKLLSPDGKIYVSINVQRSAFSVQEIETEFHNQYAADIQVTDLENKIRDEDFKDRKIPKTFLITEK